MRRQFGGRNLGHLYVYADSWPGTEATAAQPQTTTVEPSQPQPAQPPLAPPALLPANKL